MEHNHLWEMAPLTSSCHDRHYHLGSLQHCSQDRRTTAWVTNDNNFTRTLLFSSNFILQSGMFRTDWMSWYNFYTFGMCSTLVTILFVCLFLLKVSTVWGIHTWLLFFQRWLSSLQFGSLLRLAHHHKLLKEIIVLAWGGGTKALVSEPWLDFLHYYLHIKQINFQSQSSIHECFMPWIFNETEPL